MALRCAACSALWGYIGSKTLKSDGCMNWRKLTDNGIKKLFINDLQRIV
jgi:hypothetical protein